MRARAASLPRVPAREAAPVELSAPLAGGAQTTVHVAAYSLARTEVRVAALRRPEPLVDWARARAIGDAIIGGFFLRSSGRPLGELRTRGIKRRSTPFVAPWNDTRACVHVDGSRVVLAPRAELPRRPRGDLLQAGPLLVRAGERLIEDGVDPEGFSAGHAQFDSDITAGRYPRAALGIAHGALLAVVCDGRTDSDAGMTLGELAAFMAGLGAESAINLDGGGSASLVCGGALVNRPRDAGGIDIPGGRPIVTAVTFLPAV